MQQLSGLDASFLSLETPNAPMHIGGVCLIDPRTPRGRLQMEDVRALLASRLHVSRALRQRLAPVPLGLGSPCWVEDEAPDLTYHVQRTQLPEPGGFRELSALMDFELAQPLDRRRPLWQLLFVEGVKSLEGDHGLKGAGLGEIGEIPDGAVALISKVHHAAIDGMSGAEIFAALYDPTPEPREIPAPKKASAEPHPGKLDLLRQAGRGLAHAAREAPGTLAASVKGLARTGAAWGIHGLKPPPFPFAAPRTRLNKPVSRERSWGGAVLDLERIQALRRRLDATVNDVVLAVCSGALRRYLEAEDALPEKSLVAMVPVSVRATEQKKAMGNQVSAMLVSLATDLEDPAERLEAIRASVRSSKALQQAIGARTLTDSANLIPFSLAGTAARLYSRMELADRHRPLFNLVITNVPGPQVPLYVAGGRLLANIGAAPVFDGMGLILPIFSYAGTLAIGITACRRAVPEAAPLAHQFPRALAELEASFPDLGC